MPHEMVELKKNNPYYIPKERYLELKHFCRQYKEWKSACRNIDEYSVRSRYILTPDDVGYSPITGSDVERAALSKVYYSQKIQAVIESALYTDELWSDYILKAVTEGYSYTTLRMKYNMKLNEKEYYKLYRKFFWVLDHARYFHSVL